MNKHQLIDGIRHFNPTAEPKFLAQFDDTALRQYLEHLEAARQKHVRIAGFVRQQSKVSKFRIAH